MFYKLLGMAVWKGGKLFLRRRYGSKLPKSLLLGTFVAVLGGAALVVAAARHNGS
jgi:hypothetical protein